MLSASFNQTPNQGLRFNLSDTPMNDFTSNIGYHENYIPNQFYNQTHYMPSLNQDTKIYSEIDVMYQPNNNTNNINGNDYHPQLDHSTNKEIDFHNLSSRLQSINMKQSSNLSRSNSAHNSPFDNRVTPRHFSQSTSNTPIPLASRMSRDIDIMRGNAPIMQLFPNSNNSNANINNAINLNGNSCSNGANPIVSNNYSINRQSPVELIEYQSMASKMGFLVGQDLDEVLNRSATMKNSNSSRISNFFKHKHGSSGSHLTQKQYLVLGVRVPSKEHVSEIVGKEGKKIKMIRQTTGALIATPNEKEDHVFLIEAVPETAIKVGQIIQQLADQITRNKLGNITGLMGERPRSPPMLGNRTPLATATIGVPQRLVGKVIGTQGSIITTVQKETGTEIKSPPKDELRAPGDTADFEISVYENGTVNSEETAWLQIHRAKQLIAHLVMRVWDQQPRNSTPSSDEGANNNSAPLGSSASPEWMWPEVSRMDDGDAKEIIDRILRSSKAKITPSTSSTEGANIDNLVMPSQQAPPVPQQSISMPLSTVNTSTIPTPAIGLQQIVSSCSSSSSSLSSSPLFSMSGASTTQTITSGFHSNPYKLVSEDNWCRPIPDCCYINDSASRRFGTNGNFYPSQYSSTMSDCHRIGVGNHHHHHHSHFPMQQHIQGLQHQPQHQLGHLSHQNQYCSSNDSAFYDSYYPSVYSPPVAHGNNNANYISETGNGCYIIDPHQHTDTPSPGPSLSNHSNINNNHCNIDSWSKPVFFAPSNNNSNHSNGNSMAAATTTTDETRYGNVKYLWKTGSESSSSFLDSSSPSSSWTVNNNGSCGGIDINNQPGASIIQLRQNSNNRSVIIPPESMFGTIGDGRKRNSVASNSDDREDLS